MSKTPTSRSLADILGTSPDAPDPARRPGMSSSIPLTEPPVADAKADPATPVASLATRRMTESSAKPSAIAKASPDPATPQASLAARRMTGKGAT